MFKNNNVNPAKLEDNKNVICISDYYINNCSEQECVTVSDEVLEYLISARRKERAQKQRDYRHLAFSWRSEATTLEYISKALDKETIDTRRNNRTRIILSERICIYL